VAEVEHADASGEVDVLASVDIRQMGAVGVRGKDRCDRDTAGHVAVALRAHGLGL